MPHDLAVDIETSGPRNWSDLDAPTQEYLLARWQKQGVDLLAPVPVEELAQRCALELGLAEIISIGIWSVSEDRGVTLVSGRDGDEAAVLRGFWRALPHRCRLVTYDGRSFDAPMLMVRSAIHDIACERDLVGYRYDISQHCDLADCLGFMGATRSKYSLDYWCRRFGILSPKEGGTTGADIGRLHAEGDYETIATYVAGDARATARLFQRLVPMLRQFRGGPSD